MSVGVLPVTRPLWLQHWIFRTLVQVSLNSTHGRLEALWGPWANIIRGPSLHMFAAMSIDDGAPLVLGPHGCKSDHDSTHRSIRLWYAQQKPNVPACISMCVTVAYKPHQHIKGRTTAIHRYNFVYGCSGGSRKKKKGVAGLEWSQMADAPVV